MISFEGVITTEKELMRTYDVKVKVVPLPPPPLPLLNQEKPKQRRRTNTPSLGNDDSLSLHNDAHPHVRACFGSNGQLVKVFPNRPNDGQPAMVELLEVQNALGACQDAKDLNLYPGPLSREGIHKNDVLSFCQRKALKCMEDVTIVDKESAQLLWKFLDLLVKHNGTLVVKDIIDLLLEGREPDAMQYRKPATPQRDGVQSPPIQAHSLKGKSSRRGSHRNSSAKAVKNVKTRVVMDSTAITPNTHEREDHLAKFRHLLLYGKKKDAIECAVKYHLWGHAFFLSSMMDQKLRASVKTRFASTSMLLNDPLQTLYQLMSGQRPSSVTCASNEGFGDWRPHLAMILSNQTFEDNLDRKNILTLGDTLASKGRIHASHVCYLMAQVPFGTYDKKTSKIVLLGGNHHLPLKDFATVDAIQYTEVYEYSQTLSNPAFCLPHFQLYKYLYACRLLDFGLVSEAFMYCEVIASAISRHPAYFQPSFVQLVFELSSRLNYTNPQHQTSQVDPVRVQQVQGLLAQYAADFTIKPDSGMITTTDLGDSSVEWNDGSGGGGGLTHQQQQQQFGTDNETHFTMEVDDGDDDYHDEDADDFKPPKITRTVSTTPQGNEEAKDDDDDNGGGDDDDDNGNDQDHDHRDYEPSKSNRTVSTPSQGNEEDEDADDFKPPKITTTVSTTPQGNEEAMDDNGGDEDDDDNGNDQDDDDGDYKPSKSNRTVITPSQGNEEEDEDDDGNYQDDDDEDYEPPSFLENYAATEEAEEGVKIKRKSRRSRSNKWTQGDDESGGVNFQDLSVTGEEHESNTGTAPKDSINTSEMEKNDDDLDNATDQKEDIPKRKKSRPRTRIQKKGQKRKVGRPSLLSDEERAKRAARKGKVEKPFTYNLDDYMFKNADDTFLTGLEVTSAGNSKCKLCENVHSTKKTEELHIKYHTRRWPYTCVTCGYGSSYKSRFDHHMRMHTGEKKYKCSICGRGCKSQAVLTSHMRRHTGEKPFKCFTCGSCFSQKATLDLHINRVHLKIKPYICELCGKQFSVIAGLKRHLVFHSGKKTCKCSVCGKFFVNTEQLKKHKKIHLKERPKNYSCSLCEKKYYNKKSLTIHMRFHTGEKPYMCDICGKGFTQSAPLKTHLKTHTKENLYRCSMCDQAFVTSSSLSSHFKLHFDPAVLEMPPSILLYNMSDKKSDTFSDLPSLSKFTGDS